MNGENHMQDNFVEIPNQKPENESTSSRETNRSSSKEESEIILADQITPDKTIVKEIEQITEKTDIQENDEIILDETDVNEKEQITEISDIQENDNDTSADGQETKEIYGLDIHEEVSQKKKIIKRHSYSKVDNIEYKLESRLSGHVARNISGDFKAFNVETDVLFMPQLDLEYTDEEEEEEEKEEQEEDKLLIDYKTDDDIEVMMEKIANQQRERQRVEEKDDQIEFLKRSAQKISRIVNHIREKSTALYTDILDLKEEIPIQESKFLDLQNKLAVVRKQRDAMRGLITNFKIESGLLTERKLLVDMELSQNEYKVFSKQLNDLKSDYNSTISKLRNARKTLEFMLGEKQKIQKSNISKRNSITNFNKKVTTKSSTYKISLPKGVFDLKPLVTHL